MTEIAVSKARNCAIGLIEWIDWNLPRISNNISG